MICASLTLTHSVILICIGPYTHSLTHNHRRTNTYTHTSILSAACTHTHTHTHTSILSAACTHTPASSGPPDSALTAGRTPSCSRSASPRLFTRLAPRP